MVAEPQLPPAETRNRAKWLWDGDQISDSLVPSTTAASEFQVSFHQATILPRHAVNQDFSASLTTLRQEVSAFRKMASRTKWQSQRCIVDAMSMSDTMCQVMLYVTGLLSPKRWSFAKLYQNNALGLWGHIYTLNIIQESFTKGIV